jgi:hypothetical protein
MLVEQSRPVCKHILSQTMSVFLRACAHCNLGNFTVDLDPSGQHEACVDNDNVPNDGHVGGQVEVAKHTNALVRVWSATGVRMLLVIRKGYKLGYDSLVYALDHRIARALVGGIPGQRGCRRRHWRREPHRSSWPAAP